MSPRLGKAKPGGTGKAGGCFTNKTGTGSVMKHSAQKYVPNVVEPSSKDPPAAKKPRKFRRGTSAASDLAILNMVRAGMSAGKAAETLGMNYSSGYKAMDRMKGEGNDVPSLMSTARDEKLTKLLDTYLEKGAKIRKIRGSDALGAAKIYADRRFPVRQEGSKQEYKFVRVDISIYKTNQENDEPSKGTP